MPVAVALLAHPAGAYGCLIVTAAALIYGAHTRRFVPLFTALSALALTALAALHAAPNLWALLLLAGAVALLHAEFLVPTRGVAGGLGFATATWASWLALDGSAASLPPALRLMLACAGSAVLLLATVRALRLRWGR